MARRRILEICSLHLPKIARSHQIFGITWSPTGSICLPADLLLPCPRTGVELLPLSPPPAPNSLQGGSSGPTGFLEQSLVSGICLSQIQFLPNTEIRGHCRIFGRHLPTALPWDPVVSFGIHWCLLGSTDPCSEGLVAMFSSPWLLLDPEFFLLVVFFFFSWDLPSLWTRSTQEPPCDPWRSGLNPCGLGGAAFWHGGIHLLNPDPLASPSPPPHWDLPLDPKSCGNPSSSSVPDPPGSILGLGSTWGSPQHPGSLGDPP